MFLSASSFSLASFLATGFCAAGHYADYIFCVCDFVYRGVRSYLVWLDALQTLFMEMVFRKIEYLIEGNAPSKENWTLPPWTASKILKREPSNWFSHHLNIDCAHLDGVFNWHRSDNSHCKPFASRASHGFYGLNSFTLIFYAVFARFREQACIAVCPYGRLQGVLLVKDSIVVGIRLAPWWALGKIKKKETSTVKKAIALIANFACMFAPLALISATEHNWSAWTAQHASMFAMMLWLKSADQKGWSGLHRTIPLKTESKKLFTPRVFGYTMVLIALISLLGLRHFTRSDVETTVLKVPGTLYQKQMMALLPIWPTSSLSIKRSKRFHWVLK